MYCLKCGQETEEHQVFCDHCLQSMEAYPINPGTAVNLPKQSAAKKVVHRKRPLTPDEQIANLQKRLRHTRLFAWIICLLLLLSTGVLVYEIVNPDGPIIGLNYTIDTTQNAD